MEFFFILTFQLLDQFCICMYPEVPMMSVGIQDTPRALAQGWTCGFSANKNAYFTLPHLFNLPSSRVC